MFFFSRKKYLFTTLELVDPINGIIMVGPYALEGYYIILFLFLFGQGYAKEIVKNERNEK